MIRSGYLVAGVLFLIAFGTISWLREDWLFTNPYILPWFDPFVYLGFFLRYPEYVQAYPTYYPGERLAVILPGHVIFKLFEPAMASVCIRSLLWWGSVLAFFIAASRICSWRVGLLSALLLGLNPTFLGAAGWDYIDGFANCYHLIAWAIVAWLAHSPRSRTLLILLGAVFALMFLSSTFMVVFIAPLALATAWVIYQGRITQLISPLGFVILGAFLIIAGVSLINGIAGGPVFIFGSQYDAMIQLLSGKVAATNPSAWQPILWNAPWAALPLVLALSGLSYIPLALKRLRQAKQLSGAERISQLLPVFASYQMVVYGSLQATSFTALSFFCYSSLLVPLCFLYLAKIITSFVESLSRSSYAALVVLTLCATLFSLHPTIGKTLLECYAVGYYKTYTIIPVVGFAGSLLCLSSIQSSLIKGLAALLIFISSSSTTYNTPQVNHFWHERRTYGIRAIAEAVNHFQDSNRDGALGMWMNTRDPSYGENIFWASWIANHIRAGRFRSTDLPLFDPTTASAGTRVMLFTSGQDVASLITQPLRDKGFSFSVVNQRRIVHGRIDFWMTLVTLT